MFIVKLPPQVHMVLALALSPWAIQQLRLMKQDALQAWFAVHGPLLRRASAKDSLWHRVLSALAPPTAGDVAKGMVQKSGNAKIVMRQAFRTFRGQCHKVTAMLPLSCTRICAHMLPCNCASTFAPTEPSR